MMNTGLVQMVRLTKTNGGELWINPAQIVFAEIGRKKDSPEDNTGKVKPAPGKKEEFMTILHMTGKEGKVFVTEAPAEINRIIKSVKRNLKIEFQHV
ncbi:MAG: hypothetical protein ABIT05_01160 [Chitinophagaceae bacterium]